MAVERSRRVRLRKAHTVSHSSHRVDKPFWSANYVNQCDDAERNHSNDAEQSGETQLAPVSTPGSHRHKRDRQPNRLPGTPQCETHRGTSDHAPWTTWAPAACRPQKRKQGEEHKENRECLLRDYWRIVDDDRQCQIEEDSQTCPRGWKAVPGDHVENSRGRKQYHDHQCVAGRLRLPKKPK